jgi:hypothetical protein
MKDRRLNGMRQALQNDSIHYIRMASHKRKHRRSLAGVNFSQ